jgi:iron complex outermembrane receptor protein
MLLSPQARAQGGLEFLKEEGQVTSASRRPQEISRAPATVYVITSRQIKESGAQTIPDALRGVPGVDVIGSRSMASDVSIRGLDHPLPTSALVMVDGRIVQNGYYDFPIWESLPITLDEIDHIEVVEGPVSALYGPNAFQGVINIITKSPQQIGKAYASVTAGEDGLLFGTAMHGNEVGPWAYKLDLGWRSGEDFQADTQASDARIGSAKISRDMGEYGKAALSGGANYHRSQFSATTLGAPVDDGTTGFLRGDWTRGRARARGYWNYGRTTSRGGTLDTPLHYDTYDGQLEQGFQPFEGHEAVAGIEYRRNSAYSPLLFGPSERHAQDLWSLFLEDGWRVVEPLTLEADGRLDYHPLTGWRFSPRGAVVFRPVPEHTVRLSAGTAYRNPSLVENYADLTQPSGGARYTSLGMSGLGPERTTQLELAYIGRFDALRARASVFTYRADDMILFSRARQVAVGPPAQFLVPSENLGGTRAWGAEAQLEAPLPWELSAKAAWSIERLKDDDDLQDNAETSPRNKVSGTLAWHHEGWTVSTEAFWQSATAFSSNAPTDAFVTEARVADYWLLSARLAYAFDGGFEAAVSAWNMADRHHYELTPFQNGELLGRRVAATLSWRLP